MMFTTGWIIFYIFVGIWILGWISSIKETSVGQEAWSFKKIGRILLLFFIWPYIAVCMANQGDI